MTITEPTGPIGTAPFTTAPLSDERLTALVAALRPVLGDDQILLAKTDRYNRARVPAPFPVHRWSERVPDVVVMPTSTEQVAAVVRIANEMRIPVVPRDGGTGLTDGAVPHRRGIVVDVKKMNQIHELDLVNRTVTVGTGISMLKLNERLAQHGLFYPDDPASYPCSLVGGRIGTSGWSLIGSRYGHTRDLVLSFDHVLPTGDVLHVGDGIGQKISKSSSGYQLKHLFMGHQGTLGIATRATLKLFPKPEAELSPFWAFDNYDDAHACTGALARAGVATFAGAVLFDEHKVAYLRRDDEAYIPQPTDVRALVCAVMYGYEDEVRAGGRRLFRIAKEHGARYLGDEISEGDWAARHDRYATPLHGRTKDGQVIPMSWHCEDAAVNFSNVPAVSRAWHEILADLRRKTDVFDDWGMFAYTSANTGVDYLTEIDVGIWEQRLDDAAWAAWVKAKRDIAAVALAHGGSMSACHGSCREGEVDLVPEELGRGFDVMLDVKRSLDPNNIMNPGKYLLDRAYGRDTTDENR
jgi:glycolate oxidase